MQSSKKNYIYGGSIKKIIENIFSLLVALFFVFAIRSSIFEAFKIPSGSMIPTLYIGDRIFVNKFAYGLKLPFSDLLMNRPIFLTKQQIPNRGDVIVFLFPKNESIYYIKRVVGIPGDVVEMRNKILYVNQKKISYERLPAMKSEKILHSLNDFGHLGDKMDLLIEHLVNVNHTIMLDQKNDVSESFNPITVPSESLFVLGDNRDYSGDSRYWGFVPIKNVKGKAIVIWLSLTANFNDMRFNFRPERIGSWIQ